MAVIDLGKIKLSYKGVWDYSTQYSPGDIVTLGSSEIENFDESLNYYYGSGLDNENYNAEHNRQLFIFKGDTARTSYPYIPTQVVAAKNGIATTGVSTNIVENVEVHLGSYIIGSAFTIDGAVVPGHSYFHHDNFPTNTKIIGITTAVKTTSGGYYGTYTLKLDNYSIGTGTTECVPAVIGTRRVGNRYEVAVNTEDWEIYSQGLTYSGEFSKYRTYVPGDIVTKTHDDGQVSTYICITPIGPGSNRPTQYSNSSILDTGTVKGIHDSQYGGGVLFKLNGYDQGSIVSSWDQHSAYYGNNKMLRLGTNSNLGGSFFAHTPDPEFDYLGVWQSFMTSDLEPHQKATLLPNNQPVDWKGHPYLKQPGWSNLLPSKYYWNGLTTNNTYGPFGSSQGASTNSPYAFNGTTYSFTTNQVKLRLQWFDEGRRAFVLTADKTYIFTVDSNDTPYSLRTFTGNLNTQSLDLSGLIAGLSLDSNWPDDKVLDGYMRSDGKRIWLLTDDWTDGNGDTWNFLQYDLTTAFDISTGANPVLAYVPGPGRYDDGGSIVRNRPRSFTFSPNGRHLYVVGRKVANTTRSGYVATDGDNNAMGFIAKLDLRGKSYTSFGAGNDGHPSTSGAWNVEGDYTNTNFEFFVGNLKFASDATADEFRIDNIQFSTDGLTLYALGTNSEPESTNNRLVSKSKILAWNLGNPYNIKSIIEKELINDSILSQPGVMWVGSSGGASYKKTMDRFVLLSESLWSTTQYEHVWGGYEYGDDYYNEHGERGDIIPPLGYNQDNNNEWEFSRVVQRYQGGKPWHLPNDIKFKDHHWRWNTSKQKVTESAYTKIHFADGEGNTRTLGGSYSYDDSDRIQAGGTTYPSGYAGESTAPIDREFLSDETPGYGNNLFDDSLEPRTKIIQYLRFHQSIWTLQSNGIVSFAGDLSNGTHSIFPLGTIENLAIFTGRHEIPRDVFKGRSIVKLSGFQDSIRTTSIPYEGAVYALDEAGELWSWGSARLGLLGIGSENITPSQQNYAGITTTGDNGGYSAVNNVDDIQSNAPWCLGKEAFGGRKIVDFEVSPDWFVIAMDDHGDIWTWGNNTYCELGYPTMEGFVSTNCARRPQLVTSPLGYYFQGEGLDSSTAVRTQYLTGSSGSTYDMEILAGGTKVKRRDGTSYGHSAGVSVNVGYAQTVAVSASFDTVDQYQYFGLDDVVATGNASGYTNYIQYMFYGYGGASDYGDLYIRMNGTNISKVGEYNQNSVMSIVYDPNDGFVNFYFDKDGDGIGNRLVYRRDKAVVSGSYDTLLYPSFGMYGASSGDGIATGPSVLLYGEAARGISNIQITDRIVRKTWKDYGGIQKFAVRGGGSWPTSDDIGSSYMILDGQGYLWTTAPNGDRGAAGDGDLWELNVSGYGRGSAANTSAKNVGDAFTAPGLTGSSSYYAVSRKKLPYRYSAVKMNSNSNPYSAVSNLSVGLQGRINNFWRTGVTDHGTLMSVTGFSTHYGGIGENHSETWYMGSNTNYQATTSNTNDQRLPVQIKASGIAGGNRNAIDYNVGSNNVDHNVYLQDVVMASSGGGIAGVGAEDQTITFVMDKHGYLYSFGYNQYGVSGTSVTQNNSVSLDANNITYQHETLDNSWPRVYTPNHLQGKCIDVVVFGEDYTTTYVDYTNAAVATFQFDDGSLLWCGENNPASNAWAFHEQYAATGISIMKTLSGFH